MIFVVHSHIILLVMYGDGHLWLCMYILSNGMHMDIYIYFYSCSWLYDKSVAV